MSPCFVHWPEKYPDQTLEPAMSLHQQLAQLYGFVAVAVYVHDLLLTVRCYSHRRQQQPDIQTCV